MKIAATENSLSHHGLRRLVPVLALVSALGLSVKPAWALEEYWPLESQYQWVYDASYEEIFEPLRIDTTAILYVSGNGVRGGQDVVFLSAIFDGAPPLRTTDDDSRPLDGLERRLAHYRPELKETITTRHREANTGFWPFLLLGPADSNLGMRITSDRLGTWREEISNWSWAYVDAPVSIGATFGLQLIPDLASDVFLDAEIVDANREVVMPGGSFTDCVVVSYTISYGEGSRTDEEGNVVGTFTMETTGEVTFAPGIGPIEMNEEDRVIEADCPECPFEAGDVLARGSMSFLERAIPTVEESWSEMKARW